MRSGVAGGTACLRRSAGRAAGRAAGREPLEKRVQDITAPRGFAARLGGEGALQRVPGGAPGPTARPD